MVWPSFSTSPGQLTQFSRRIPGNHLAVDMGRTIARAYDQRTANFLVQLDGEAEEILPAELGRGQRLPHLLGRGGDVDGVNGPSRGPQ
jgi:hypothetical protein